MHTKNANTSKLIRKSELLRNLPISLRTLDTLIAAHLLPYIKIGKVVLFDYEEVLAALEKFKRHTKDQPRKVRVAKPKKEVMPIE